jgi:hypothetical protein
MGVGTRLVDSSKVVVGLHATVPSSASPRWVSMKGYNHLTAIITFQNATTVTGSVIGFAQAQDVSGTGSTVLQFTNYWACVDDSSSVALTRLNPAGAMSFTTDATNSKSGFYIVEIDVSTLDNNNGFGCIQVTVGNAIATTIEVIYILGENGRYEGDYLSLMDPLAN